MLYKWIKPQSKNNQIIPTHSMPIPYLILSNSSIYRNNGELWLPRYPVTNIVID